MKVAILAALVTSSIAAAEVPKEPTELQRFVGTWKLEGTVAFGKDTGKVAGTWTCKPIAAKWGAQCNLVITGIPGMKAYEETDLFGYEPNSKTYHWYSVTNAGETHDHVASSIAGSKLAFVYKGISEGKAFEEVIAIDMTTRSLALRAETFVAGASTSVFDIKAKK